ncbi:MAG: hypothetical protein ACK5DD_08350 [Cyclobacteriaceae bacterium]|jgi:antitoxin YefM
MEATFRLNAKDVNDDLVQSIRQAFGDKDIEITITEHKDETEYLLSTEANRKQLYQSMEELGQSKGVAMTVAELQAKYLQ